MTANDLINELQKYSSVAVKLFTAIFLMPLLDFQPIVQLMHSKQARAWATFRL